MFLQVVKKDTPEPSLWIVLALKYTDIKYAWTYEWAWFFAQTALSCWVVTLQDSVIIMLWPTSHRRQLKGLNSSTSLSSVIRRLQMSLTGIKRNLKWSKGVSYCLLSYVSYCLLSYESYCKCVWSTYLPQKINYLLHIYNMLQIWGLEYDDLPSNNIYRHAECIKNMCGSCVWSTYLPQKINYLLHKNHTYFWYIQHVFICCKMEDHHTPPPTPHPLIDPHLDSSGVHLLNLYNKLSSPSFLYAVGCFEMMWSMKIV